MYTQEINNQAELTKSKNLTRKERHEFAKTEMQTILKRIWKWVFIGVGIGALIHGLVPQEWFATYFNDGQWWTVPLASLVAIPMYINASGAVPIMESLLLKGVSLGTTLAFCMSAVAVSLPEFMMLKQVMTFRLLAFIVTYLFIAISIMGWIFNFIYA
jgi:uncharacterized membrane protein YraQ (UPF0718 family)